MAQQIHDFLGANSAQGFSSLYDEVFHDPRIQTVWLIKGGSGNGKSTVMRSLGAVAERRGLAQEYVLCSSDPDSLDGVLLPQAGLAVLDATAPHVVEPPLCGMGVFYVNMSGCYRPGMEQSRAQLLQAQRQNQSQYPPAYACLSAAAKLTGQLEQAAQGQKDAAQLARLADGMAEAEFSELGAGAATQRRFFCGITPKGVQYRTDAVQALCSRVYVLCDSYGMSHALLKLLHQMALARGYFCMVGSSPLTPEKPEQLLVPEASAAFVRSAPQLPYSGSAVVQVDLDALCADGMAGEDTAFLRCTAQALVQRAVKYLQQAKAHHDRLEQLCKPYVDFAAVSALQSRLCAQLEKLLDGNPEGAIPG